MGKLSKNCGFITDNDDVFKNYLDCLKKISSFGKPFRCQELYANSIHLLVFS